MKTAKLRFPAVLVTSTVFFLSSCSSAVSDWRKASTDNTVAAYQEFIAAHPKDEHASEAKTMILQLQDNDAWMEAQHTATKAGYRVYLEGFLQGTHTVAARDAITALDRADAWKTAQSGDAAALKSFLDKYPTGPEADQAKSALEKLTVYHVELAKVGSDKRAQEKLAKLKTQLKDQVPDLQVVSGSGKSSFAIESGGMTDEDANTLCKTLKQHGQACQVVKSSAS